MTCSSVNGSGWASARRRTSASAAPRSASGSEAMMLVEAIRSTRPSWVTSTGCGNVASSASANRRVVVDQLTPDT